MTQKYSKYKDSGIEWIGEIPEHWEAGRLSSWFDERRQKVSDKDFEPLSVTKNGIFPQLENAAKSNDGDNRKLVKKGDFVINSRSDRKGSSGVSQLDGSVSLINIVITPRNISGAFINYLLKSNSFVEEFYKYGHGIVADLWTTRYDEMKFIKLAMPPLPEQESIAQFLDEKCARIDEAVRMKEKQIDLLKEYRQIAIHKTVTKGLNDQVKMKDSGIEWIGEIPEHWEVIPLNYIGFTQNGISKGGEYFGKGTPFISYSDVYKNETLPQHIKGLVKATSNEMLQYSVEKGDVFFTRTSETVDEIGLSSVALENFENATFAGFLIRFRFTKNIYLPEFSKYYFRSKTHRPFFVGKMNLVIRASLSQELLKKMPVLIPPLAEQTQIVAHLESLTAKTDEAIHLKKQQIEHLKQYKNSLINEVVTGKIRVS